MSMTPEEKVNRDIWNVLQKIKKEYLLAGDEPIEYRLTNVVGVGITPRDTEVKVLYKLGRDKAIRIIESQTNWRGSLGYFTIQIIQPKFSEVYDLYRKACDLQSYLTNSQKSIRRNKKPNLPKFLEVRSNEDSQGKISLPELQKKYDDYLKDIKKQEEEVHFSNEVLFYVCHDLKRLHYYNPADEKILYKPNDKLVPGKVTFSEIIGEAIFFLQSKDVIKVLKEHRRQTRRFEYPIAWEIQVFQPKLNDFIDNTFGELSLKQFQPQEVTDYSDKATRKGVEKSWDLLQATWSAYISYNKPDEMLVPITNLVIKGRSVHETDAIVKGLQKEGCFKSWHRGSKNYSIREINHTKLAEIYRDTKSMYASFAKFYQSRKDGEAKKPLEISKQKVKGPKNLLKGPLVKHGGWEPVTKNKKVFIHYQGDKMTEVGRESSNKSKFLLFLFENFNEPFDYQKFYESIFKRNYLPRGKRAEVNRNMRNEVNVLRNRILEAARKNNIDTIPYIETDRGFRMYLKPLKEIGLEDKT